MSFGVGIGDCIAVIQLANKLRKGFADAPSQFEDISNEVRNLSVVLLDVDVVFSELELDEQQEKHFQQISESSWKVLSDLEAKLEEYCDITETGRQGVGKKAKKVWKRLTLEPKDIHELRARITSTIVQCNTFIALRSSETGFATKKAVDQLVQHQDDEDRLDLLNWLSPLDYSSDQQVFINKRQQGTGQWLIESKQYQAWLETPGQVLFCPGIPGAGKTILASVVIDDITTKFQTDPSVGFAYIYFNYRQQNQQTVENLMASLLKQLVERQPSLPLAVQVLGDQMSSWRRPSISEIGQALESVIGLFSKSFIVVDALDECQESDECRTEFLTVLLDIQAKSGLNLLATSRSIPSIEEKFSEFPSLKIRAQDEDIRTYLNSRISRSALSVLKKHSEEIINGILEVADGMFQLAYLHFELVKTKKTPKKIHAALKTLPTGPTAYYQAYEEAMTRIASQDPDSAELANQILSWIISAQRPLTSLELQHALAVEVDESELDEMNITPVNEMISVCVGLVTVDEETDAIRLVHYSAQEYFRERGGHWFPKANAEITTATVTYLSFDVFKDGACETDEEFEDRLKANPLYDYAAHHWGHHAHAASAPCDGVMEFLAKDAQVEASIQVLLTNSRASEEDYTQDFPGQMTGLHLAAYFGIEDAVEKLIETGMDLDPLDEIDRTPLSWAAGKGHAAVAELLLKTGKVDVDSKDSKFNPAQVIYALVNGYQAGTSLFEPGETELKDGYGTPMSRACEEGHAAVVKVLLKYRSDQIKTPISLAAMSGHTEVVKILLETGKVGVDEVFSGTDNLLAIASRSGHSEVAELLINKGADTEVEDQWGETFLSRDIDPGGRKEFAKTLKSSLDLSIKKVKIEVS
ncbi:hypothetical protein G7Z17_g4692 [Cylindrodendrum hubeiense]|uniref:NACHT domain-containing protein n=1 Tax=Cylindrodendrum hubeiense TaxID=595255 RepID=A0A9P5HAB0_9HYPO|nr:hypothetical protein G7Z17_g4692 [Cylindrodendrum hubeiense]